MQKVSEYQDHDFNFRRKMIRNIPYLTKISPKIVEDILYHLKPRRYEAGTVIVKCGDSVDQLMLLKSGQIFIEIPYRGKNIYLDSLNEGSCFCIYAPFAQEDMQQIVNFRATTTCVIESIEVEDLKMLSKKYLELSDVMKTLQISINNQDKTDLDFFRYRPPRDKPFPEDLKKQIRRKFRAAVINFYHKFKRGESKRMLALDALREF